MRKLAGLPKKSILWSVSVLVLLFVSWEFQAHLLSSVGQPLQAHLWPGGAGIAPESSVTIKSVEKDGQGKIIKSVETTKIDEGKTLWDWLSLLGVPASLVILGFWFQHNQQKSADKAAKELRDIAADEAKEEILQVYFDRISVLLVDKNLLAIAKKVKASIEEQELLDSAVDVIRARTLSILRRFEGDAERKTSVIRFLIESDIVSKLKLNLNDANLGGINLRYARLSGINLMRANLSGADLRYADLIDSILFIADFSGANLSRANLSGAALDCANLSGANLVEANLSGAHLVEANLSRADLSGADLSRADLSRANITIEQLQKAKLCGTKIPKAISLDPNAISFDPNRDCLELASVTDQQPVDPP